MSTAREDVLARVRAATGGVEPDAAARYAAIPRGYKRAGTLDAEARLELFVDRLVDYDAVVYRCQAVDLAKTIARALTLRNRRRMLVPADFPVEILPDGLEFVVDRELSYDELDATDGVITGCTVAVAFTGTIVLQDGQDQGRRALSLVPDYHLCLVGRDQIVETLPEAMKILSTTGASATTFISGPSATSDIEMTRIKGVHGPRTLEVIVIL